jgi:hypothetical protein
MVWRMLRMMTFSVRLSKQMIGQCSSVAKIIDSYVMAVTAFLLVNDDRDRMLLCDWIEIYIYIESDVFLFILYISPGRTIDIASIGMTSKIYKC